MIYVCFENNNNALSDPKYLDEFLFHFILNIYINIMRKLLHSLKFSCRMEPTFWTHRCRYHLRVCECIRIFVYTTTGMVRREIQCTQPNIRNQINGRRWENITSVHLLGIIIYSSALRVSRYRNKEKCI